jgi:hypothetical protein
MKRDLSLIRDLLLKLEAMHDRPFATWMVYPHDDKLAVEGYTAEQIGHALELIVESGLIHTQPSAEFSADGALMFKRLSWECCEHLDDVRDPEVWRRTKEGASKIGGASLSFAWEMAKAYGKHVAKGRPGLDL